MKKYLMLFFSLVFCNAALAEEPILVIGASYGNASTPFNDNLQGALGGVSVGLGSYLSLGNALVRDRRLSGYVINEAQAGATTFDRPACAPTCDPAIGLQGFDKQLTKALARVTARDANGDIVRINARYVLFVSYNDCNHSAAFGVPQSQTSPCTTTEFNELADRLIAVGQRVVDLGLTPVFLTPPTYDQLDLQLTKTLFGFDWVIDEASYIARGELISQRLENELPNAVELSVWRGFNHFGDGLHPDDKSSRKAAKRIAKFIKANQ